MKIIQRFTQTATVGLVWLANTLGSVFPRCGKMAYSGTASCDAVPRYCWQPRRHRGATTQCNITECFL